MPRCKPGCVSSFSGSDRQKWNYVKSLYLRNYDIDENGNRTTTFNETGFTTAYENDRQEWQDTQPGRPFEKWLQWRFDVGTAQTANLPQYKRNNHDGHSWMPCPYDSAKGSSERSEIMLDNSDAPTLTRVAHVYSDRNYYMQTDSRGNEWGWTCTYDDCPYFIYTGGALDGSGNVISGARYFYK